MYNHLGDLGPNHVQVVLETQASDWLSQRVKKWSSSQRFDVWIFCESFSCVTILLSATTFLATCLIFPQNKSNMAKKFFAIPEIRTKVQRILDMFFILFFFHYGCILYFNFILKWLNTFSVVLFFLEIMKKYNFQIYIVVSYILGN